MKRVALSLNNISHYFGHQAALKEVCLEIFEGDRILLLGRNGSGKTTLLKICASLLRPTSGKVIYYNSPNHIPYQNIGYTSHELGLYGSLTIQENFSFFCKLRKTPLPSGETLRRWGLDKLYGTIINKLSRGTQSKVALLCSLVGDPSYLIMDEPTTNLDPGATEVLKQECMNMLSHNTSNAFLILASHDFTRMFELATRTVVLSSGKVVFDSHNNKNSSYNLETIQKMVL